MGIGRVKLFIFLLLLFGTSFFFHRAQIFCHQLFPISLLVYDPLLLNTHQETRSVIFHEISTRNSSYVNVLSFRYLHSRTTFFLGSRLSCLCEIPYKNRTEVKDYGKRRKTRKTFFLIAKTAKTHFAVINIPTCRVRLQNCLRRETHFLYFFFFLKTKIKVEQLHIRRLSVRLRSQPKQNWKRFFISHDLRESATHDNQNTRQFCALPCYCRRVPIQKVTFQARDDK